MRTFAELQRRPVHSNGFACPPNPLQVVTYLVMLTQACVSAACLAALLPDNLRVTSTQVVFGAVSGSLQVATVVLGAALTYSDPTDPVVYAHRKALAQG